MPSLYPKVVGLYGLVTDILPSDRRDPVGSRTYSLLLFDEAESFDAFTSRYGMLVLCDVVPGADADALADTNADADTDALSDADADTDADAAADAAARRSRCRRLH